MIELPLVVNLSGDIPLAKRVEQLVPFFNPPPGHVLKINETDFQNLDEQGNTFLLRGFLEVTAPKKSCLTIQKDASTRDIRVCNGKRARIPYNLEEIDDFGRIYLQVLTSDLDFGTQVFWNTPYRRAWVVDNQMPWPGPSRGVYLKSCKIEVIEKRRHIYLETQSEKKWQITLPEKDVPSKPDFDTYRLNSDGTETLVADKKPPPPKSEQQDTKKQNTSTPIQADKFRIARKWKTDWQFTYDLSGSEFNVGEGSLPIFPGKCRYGYHSNLPERDIGIIECTGILGYKWLFAPLSCLKPEMNPNVLQQKK